MSIKDLILSKDTEPITYFVNFYKITKPSSNITDESTCKILKTNDLIRWKIQGDELVKISSKNLGIFFDQESYIIQWLFDLKVDNTILKESLVYNWKGQSATKGYSPLPSEIEENCPVERIVQWSEPALFFHGFPGSLFTFSGQENAFNRNAPHLMFIRGEVSEEIHLYELPCLKQTLRSRATFLLIAPKHKLFLYWHGSKSIKVNIGKPHEDLIKWEESWADFSVQKLEEFKETSAFNDIVEGADLGLQKPLLKSDFSPKLFYLNSITGRFLATKVEYPLRADNVIAPFPFLQSHLYTAAQPAIFLLDNDTDVWLWKGLVDDSNNEAFKAELKFANELAENYVKEKEVILSENVTLHFVSAGKEPADFKVIFPFWKD
ncbi:unnamed protein product [Ceutorhynchus assimilis]|uniref:Supervillin n=1 Tax=Ceutorhynchus assimilis TaxID=467358 RepID=A0A9N9MKD2_9CUCU|nr:unnamed protein product [Ceutorhynchus assimilis]